MHGGVLPRTVHMDCHIMHQDIRQEKRESACSAGGCVREFGVLLPSPSYWQVRGVVKAYPSLKRISFLSHSLGGVVSRYAVALLLDADPATPSGPVETGHSALLFDKLEGSQDEAEGRNGSPRSGDGGARLAQEGRGAANTLREETSAAAEACRGSEEAGNQGHPPQGDPPRGRWGTPRWAQAAVHSASAPSGLGGAGAGAPSSPPLPTLIEDVSFRSRGSLPRHTLCGLEPINFITMASPHLGSRAKGAVGSPLL